jgi:hypothetical protein
MQENVFYVLDLVATASSTAATAVMTPENTHLWLAELNSVAGTTASITSIIPMDVPPAGNPPGNSHRIEVERVNKKKKYYNLYTRRILE